MPKTENKLKIWAKVHEYLKKYKNIFVCQIKDLPADIVHRIRKLLRGVKSEAVCGKSTVIGKSIDDFIEKNPKLPNHLNKELLEKIKESLAGLQVMIVFSNQDLAEIQRLPDNISLKNKLNQVKSPLLKSSSLRDLLEWMPLKLSISRLLKSQQRL